MFALTDDYRIWCRVLTASPPQGWLISAPESRLFWLTFFPALTYIDHLVFRVADLTQTERFYPAIIGPPLEADEETVLFQWETRFSFSTLCDSKSGPKFDKERIGLNHLAFGVRMPGDLIEMAERLRLADISNSGIQRDHYGDHDFI